MGFFDKISTGFKSIGHTIRDAATTVYKVAVLPAYKSIKPIIKPTDFGWEYFNRTFSNVRYAGIDESPTAMVNVIIVCKDGVP